MLSKERKYKNMAEMRKREYANENKNEQNLKLSQTNNN